MTRMQRHRGPDGFAVHLSGSADAQVAFGHNRLSIVDLSDGAAQPMRSADGRYTLVYNGAVYNWPEIAAELPPGALDARLGRGDSAVVFAALKHWGPAALERFNGMWALIFHDAVKQTLLVSRDRLGIKPLYYHQSDEGLLFASEIKSILGACNSRFRINPEAAVAYLSLGLVNSSAESIFEGIFNFPIASYEVIDLRRALGLHRIRRYWQHPVERGERARPGMVSPKEIAELFTDAVALCLRSDVPVGTLLSGGIDSSAIAGAAASLGQPLTAFSLVWQPSERSEEPYIDAVAARHGLPTVKFDVTRHPLDLLDLLPEATWANDGPVAGIEDVARLPLMELARDRGFKVMICGQGGDEQLAGYRKFFFFWLRELLGEGSYGSAARLVYEVGRERTVLRDLRLSEMLRYASGGWLARHSFIGERHLRRPPADLGYHLSYAEREWEDMKCLSLPTMLHAEDRMSMARSVETRVPFLDHRLVEALAHVHPSEKFRNGWTKGIFREAIGHLLPPEVQYRRDKNARPWPVAAWLRNEYRPRLQATFSGRMRAAETGLIDQASLQAAYRRFLRGRGVIGAHQIMRAYAFESFLERFAQYLDQSA